MAIVLNMPLSQGTAYPSLESELVTNGDMELDANWANYGTPAANVRSSGQQQTLDYSRKVTLGGVGAWGGIQQTISGLTLGASYLITCWVRGLDLATGTIYLAFAGNVASITASNGDWIRLEGVGTVTATAHPVVIYVWPTAAGNAGKSFYVDNVSIKEITDPVTNGNMEADSDWDNQGSPATNVRSNEQAHSGTYSRKITLDGVGSYGGIISADAITFVVGKSYIVTGWAYNLDMSNGERLVMDCTQFSAGAFSIYPNQGVWTQWSEVVIATGTSGKILFYNWPTDVAEANKSYYVDDVSIYEVEFQDLSGQDNDGAPANIPVFTADHDGNANGATVFNGTTDYINIDAVLSDLSATTVGSFCAWVKLPDATTAQGRIIGFGDANAAEVISLNVEPNGKLELYLAIPAGIQWWVQTTNAVFSDNIWVHVAIVQDGADPVLYVNGVAVAQGFIVGSDKTIWFSDMAGLDKGRMGNLNFNNSGESFFSNLLISDARIYNINLSEAEINAIMSGSSQAISGSITPSGALVPIPIFVVPLSGSITPAGALSIAQPDWLLIDEILAWKGEWDAAYSYDIADTVLYKSTDGNEWHAFVSKIGHNVGNIPVSTSAAWRRLYQEKFL